MRETESTLHWNRSSGWRAGSRYVEPGASAAAVITHEQDELGNDLGVPPFLLEALHQIPAQDIVWVCRTRDHARRYGGEGRGQPYKEDVGEGALILATDHEAPETGYLLLKDATRLD